MTDFQLLLATGIPTLAVVLGIVYTNARFNLMQTNIDTRFNSVDIRFNSLETRLSSLEQRLIVIEADLRRIYEIWVPTVPTSKY